MTNTQFVFLLVFKFTMIRKIKNPVISHGQISLTQMKLLNKCCGKGFRPLFQSTLNIFEEKITHGFNKC